MAATLTQQQWYDKLTSFVPAWVFEEENATLSQAIFQAMAQLFYQIDSDANDQFDATFLLKETAPVLDMAGDERSKVRLSGELDATFAARIQRITSQTDPASIRSAITAIMPVGYAWEVDEDFNGSIFCSRSYFLNRSDLLYNRINCGFTVKADNGLDLTIAAALVDLLNSTKAFGVLYRLVFLHDIVLTEAADYIQTEDGFYLYFV